MTAATNPDAVGDSLGLSLNFPMPKSILSVRRSRVLTGTVATEHHVTTCTICAELAERAPQYALRDRKTAATCAVITDGGRHGARWTENDSPSQAQEPTP